MYDGFTVTTVSQFVNFYDTTSMQYTLNFNGCKNDNFQIRKGDVFLIFAQNIDCGYTLEPPCST